MFRFTHSSTKDMYIDNIRIALLNYICAKQKNDRFIVRIDDLDKSINRKKEEKDILNLLKIFGMKYDGIYYQSNSFKYHLQFASTLLDEKKAFMCFCTKQELRIKRKNAKNAKKIYNYDGTCENLDSEYILNSTKPFTIRIKKPTSGISFHDSIKGDLTFDHKTIDSFMIMRVNKYPTYDFACAIDDMLQGITYIIKEDSYILNTAKQEYIRRSLGYNGKITYIHLPPPLDRDGKSINITDDIYNVQWLLNQGYMPEAITNYLLLIGNKAPKEIFKLDEALEWFDIDKISKSPPIFDINKLKFINVEQIKLLSDEELAKRVGYSGKNIGKLAKLYTKEAGTTFEIKQKIDAIFTPKRYNGKFRESFNILKNIALNAPKFDKFSNFKKFLAQQSGYKDEHLGKLLRILLTNAQSGPELAHLYPLIKNYIKEVIK